MRYLALLTLFLGISSPAFADDTAWQPGIEKYDPLSKSEFVGLADGTVCKHCVITEKNGFITKISKPGAGYLPLKCGERIVRSNLSMNAPSTISPVPTAEADCQPTDRLTTTPYYEGVALANLYVWRQNGREIYKANAIQAFYHALSKASSAEDVERLRREIVPAYLGFAKEAVSDWQDTERGLEFSRMAYFNAFYNPLENNLLSPAENDWTRVAQKALDENYLNNHLSQTVQSHLEQAKEFEKTEKDSTISAIVEYAQALRIDPNNQEALTGYKQYLAYYRQHVSEQSTHGMVGKEVEAFSKEVFKRWESPNSPDITQSTKVVLTVRLNQEGNILAAKFNIASIYPEVNQSILKAVHTRKHYRSVKTLEQDFQGQGSLYPELVFSRDVHKIQYP